MARSTPTRQYVRDIAAELQAAGVTPTQSKIRELIRERYQITASPNLVGGELAAFLASTTQPVPPSSIAPKIPSSEPLRTEQMTEASSGYSPELWSAALAAAKDALLSLDPTERSRASAKVQQASVELELTQAKLAEANDSRAAMQQSLSGVSQLQEQLRNSELQIASLSLEVQSLKDAHERTISMYEARLAEARQLHSAEIDRLNSEKKREFEMWEGLRKHLLMETDRIRTDHSTKIEILNEQLERSHLFEIQWKNQASQLTEQISAANTRAFKAEQRLLEFQTAKR